MKTTALIRQNVDLSKGVVAGIAGGLIASFFMEQFQAAWTKVASAFQGGERSQSDEKPATVKVADAVLKRAIGHGVPKSKESLAGDTVHYAMGATSAAIYGVLAELIPNVTAGDGLLFGMGVWALADEVAVPALGFSKSPKKIPLSTHVYSLASHLVYGWVTEVVRSRFRRAR